MVATIKVLGNPISVTCCGSPDKCEKVLRAAREALTEWSKEVQVDYPLYGSLQEAVTAAEELPMGRIYSSLTETIEATLDPRPLDLLVLAERESIASDELGEAMRGRTGLPFGAVVVQTDRLLREERSRLLRLSRRLGCCILVPCGDVTLTSVVQAWLRPAWSVGLVGFDPADQIELARPPCVGEVFTWTQPHADIMSFEIPGELDEQVRLDPRTSLFWNHRGPGELRYGDLEGLATQLQRIVPEATNCIFAGSVALHRPVHEIHLIVFRRSC